ncbi:FAST kinase domain-containing protein 2, mitochondrial Precursor [Channa argus]|uniref:FAST kinase domain-containing protein 2, mitochondrial n=1 Tax=Channa argus TaxID=215402 RepID=A0A6G1QUN4_CHAAH|nr:FAST kinase domain-containing protein 2, mitochondrial Precursor [Channa argus]
MSIWVTEEVMRWALRFCNRRFLWRQHSVLKTASIKDTSLAFQQLTHVCCTKKIQTGLTRSSFSPVRFYSPSKIHSDELEEKKHLSSSPEEASMPAEIQSAETTSEQRQRRSPFLDHLQNCTSPSDVLDLTCQYAPSAGQISNCLNRMWSTTKKMSDEQRHYELQLMFEHPAFDRLLQKAMKSAWEMHSHHVAYSLLSMVKLGVPQETRVVNTFLRTCQEKLNDFDEKSLSILASCLEHMESSPNIGALKHGMRLVVEARLPGIKTVIALQTMMRLLGKDAPLDLKRKLERKALSMTDQFSLPNTQYMICTMATMGFYSKPLLDVCSTKMTENLHGVPFNRLYTVLRSCKELRYRNLDMLIAISDYIASTQDIWTNKQLLLLLSVFENLAFCPAALMEGFAEKMIANPDALTLKDLLCVLKHLTIPPSVLGDPNPSIPSVNPQLSLGLQSMLGDQADTVTQEMVVVENFYVIDAVITKPVPNRTSVTEASSCTGDNLSPAESSQRIAVICPPQSSFCYGTSNPRGPLAVKIRHLQILGYIPVSVTEQELQSEEMRTELLRGRIFPERHRSETDPKMEHLAS